MLFISQIMEQHSEQQRDAKSTELKVLQQEVDDLIQQMGGYWTPYAMFLSLAEEVGELARQINHYEKVKIKKPTEPKKDIDEEIGDTLYSLICIANYYNIDLAQSLRDVMEKYRKRDANRYSAAPKK